MVLHLLCPDIDTAPFLVWLSESCKSYHVENIVVKQESASIAIGLTTAAKIT
jgi:hypothetical protein